MRKLYNFWFGKNSSKYCFGIIILLSLLFIAAVIQAIGYIKENEFLEVIGFIIQCVTLSVCGILTISLTWWKEWQDKGKQRILTELIGTDKGRKKLAQTMTKKSEGENSV